MIKAAIFDVDGVIIVSNSSRFSYKIFSQRIAEEYGASPESLSQFFNEVFPKCLVGKADLKKLLNSPGLKSKISLAKKIIMYFVYLLQCKDNTLYTGITTNLKRRFKEHGQGKGGAYTRARKVVKILYFEKKNDRSSALKREREIKRLTHKQKLALV